LSFLKGIEFIQKAHPDVNIMAMIKFTE